MANILNLIAKFDTKEVKEGAKDIEGLKGKLADLTKEIPGLGSAFSSAESTISTLGSSLGSLSGLALAAAGALGVLGVSMAFKYNDIIDGFGDMGEKFGYSATQAYFLSTAAKQAGGSLESLISMGEKLSKAMAKAGDDTKGTGLAFAKMGVDSKDASGHLKSTDEVAGELIAKFEAGNKTTSDYAAMTQLLGKGFEQLIPVYKSVKDANEVANEFQEKGIGITKRSLEVTGESEKAQLKLGGVFTSMGSILVEAVIPAFTTVTNWFVKSYTEGGFVAKAFGLIAVAAEVVTGVFKVLATGVLVVIESFSLGVDTLSMFGKIMYQIATGDYSKIGDTFNKGVDGMRVRTQSLSKDLQGLQLHYEGSSLQKMFKGDSVISRTKSEIAPGRSNLFTGTAGGEAAPDSPEKSGKQVKVEDPNKEIDRLIESLTRQKSALENINKEKMISQELDDKKYSTADGQLKAKALELAISIDTANANKFIAASMADLDKSAKNYANSIKDEIAAKTMSTREIKANNAERAIEAKFQEEITKLKTQALWTQQRENDLLAKKEASLAAIKTATAEGVAADKDYINNGINAYVKGLGTMEEASAKLITNGLKGLEDGFVDLFTTGAMDFNGFVKTIIDGLVRMMVQFTIIEPIMKAFQQSMKGGMGGGGGLLTMAMGIFGNQGLVSAHATGTVSTGKTGLFGGSPVLIGESGDEAIMPLKRNAAGDLGVVSQGGSGATKQGDTNYSISVSIGSVDSAERQAELMKNIEQLITVKTKQTIADQSRKGNAFAR